jgi:hypothetical protein
VATFSWTRAYVTAQPWGGSAGSHLLVKLNTGQSIVSTLCAWGFGGTTGTTIIPAAVLGQVAAFGVVTTIGNGTETPPDALAAPNNAAPPSRRWLIWDVRAPTIAAWDSGGQTVAWTASPPISEGTTEAQVLAPSGMGTGNTLNAWMSWSTFGGWDGSGQAVLWFSSQVLVRSP